MTSEPGSTQLLIHETPPAAEQQSDAPLEQDQSQSLYVTNADGILWVTVALLFLLIGAYVIEVEYGLGDWEVGSQRRLAQLFTFGGIARNWVLTGGEWYRLFSAPFLHGDLEHLFWNSAALCLAGYLFEWRIGSALFAAIYTVGAIGGSVPVLLFRPDNLVFIGASAGISALYAAMLTANFAFPKGPTRTKIRIFAILMLLSALLPSSPTNNVATDYIGHFAGAIGGALLGLLASALKSDAKLRSRFQLAALAVAALGLAGTVYAGTSVSLNYAVSDMRTALPDRSQLPATDAEIQVQIVELVERYPRDPRLRIMHANVLLQRRDMANAEHELRAGLLEEHIWIKIFPREMSHHIHTLLALVLADTSRLDEARQTAKEACSEMTTVRLRAALDQKEICAN